MKIDSRKPRHWFLLGLQLGYTLIAIAFRWLRKKPQKPITILYGHQFSGNLKALYCEWVDSYRDELDLYFLSLDPEYSTELRYAGIQVLQCNRLTDMLILGKSAALISDHGLHLMSPLLRFTDIKFIDVWHGIPFKGFTPEDFKLQHRYHEIWVSSPLLKNLYVDKFGFDADQVCDLGYARTDQLFKRDFASSGFREAAAIPAEKRIVLYAPTWKQDNSGRELFPFDESGSAFIHTLSEICEANNACFLIRSHLNADMTLKDIHQGTRFCPQRDYPDTEDLLLATDILICDWSSIAFDFLAVDKPTIFLDVQPPFKNGFSLGEEYRFGFIARDMEFLCSTLTRYLVRPESYDRDYGSSSRRITQCVYGNNTDGRASNAQLQRLLELIGSTSEN
jgi:CDP-glycerol glycerophosphotransferase (TagB/SpsB family)